MKRKNLIFQIVSLIAIVGLIAVGCQKNNDSDLSVKKGEIGFNVQFPDLSNKKTDPTDQFYGNDCTYEEITKIEVKYYLGSINDEVSDSDIITEELEVLNYFGPDDKKNGVASQLLQIEIPETETEQIITVTQFNVYKIETGTEKEDIVMATPMSESAYSGYVGTSLPMELTINEFEKSYTLMEVLCFQEDDYLEFGFTWFDFNIVEGYEYCAFFNCIGSDASSYHTVLTADIEVYEGDIDAEESPYFTSSVAPAEGEDVYEVMCIPVPGTYKTPEVDVNAVMTMKVITPDGNAVIIPVSKDDIDTFVGGQLEVPNVVTFPESKDGYTYVIVGNPENEDEVSPSDGVKRYENIAHYQLDNCGDAE